MCNNNSRVFVNAVIQLIMTKCVGLLSIYTYIRFLNVLSRLIYKMTNFGDQLTKIQSYDNILN